jgi:2-dehydro-3-deoxyphosphooctonate aldolase (KDO 8-P synthase)
MTSNSDGKDEAWILGPCSSENKNLYIETGLFLAELMHERNWYYKASFDKANRTAIHGGRGPGLQETIAWAKELKEIEPSIKLTTDVHETHQVGELVGYFDLIQIPAFLCRQTDLLVECGKNFDFINVKKGLWLTERGTTFGYGNLTVDFGAATFYRKHFDRVILDCTHSTQQKKGDFTGGDRTLAEKFMLASLAFDYNGIFAETHPNPPEAVSDGDCQIFLNRMPDLIKKYDQLAEIYKC